MTLVLLMLIGIPILWLLGLIWYLVGWVDWDKPHAHIPK